MIVIAVKESLLSLWHGLAQVRWLGAVLGVFQKKHTRYESIGSDLGDIIHVNAL